MRKIGISVALLLGSCVGTATADAAEDLTPERRQELENKATALNEEGRRFYVASNYVKAIEIFREALDTYRVLYPNTKYPDGHPELATSINNLGFMHVQAGEYGKAEMLYREALDMKRALYPKSKFPDGHTQLTISINNLGSLHQDAGEYSKAEMLYREALDMKRALYPKSKYPDGHLNIVISIGSLGQLYQYTGEYGKPVGLRTVYLTADGALHQVPWAALPGAKPGTVLLEQHAICLVPHGPFLLHRLQDKKPIQETAGRLLAVGGIDYQDCSPATEAPAIALREAALPARGVRWPALKGTDKERKQVATLARRKARLEVTERSGKEASTEQFQRDLPLARYAHVATHGFFADPKFRSALQIDPSEFGTPGMRDRRGGGRSPLSLSGLVFAGANRSGTEAAEDRGILTAEGLIGLRMEGLELAVLSACETGLGAFGGGEGVYGLQRAFHVAGCRSVVASLWKVDDAATEALMALFYANLWDRKLDPAEALRQAQLSLYRNPTAVAVAQRRGVDFSESDLPKVVSEPGDKAKRTPPAQWAAFTFSGVRPVKKD